MKKNRPSWTSVEEFYKFHGWVKFNPNCARRIAIELFEIGKEDLTNQPRVSIYTATIKRLKEKARICTSKIYKRAIINHMRTNIRMKQQLLDRRKASKNWFLDNSRKLYGFSWCCGATNTSTNLANEKFKEWVK